MRGFGSVEGVVAAIHEEARAEAERIETEAEAAIAQLRLDDRLTPVVVPGADARLAAARARARALTAQEDWADREATLDAREQWMAQAVAMGTSRLRTAEPVARRTALLHLACEAIDHVGGQKIELAIGNDEAVLADAAWVAELEQLSGRKVSVMVAPTITGGCIARSEDGRLSFDNTYAGRARRFESDWRQALGELLQAGTTVVAGANAS